MVIIRMIILVYALIVLKMLLWQSCLIENFKGNSNMKNSVAIIDFGSSEIVTLVGVLGACNTLNILGKGRVFYAGFQNGEFLEPEQLKEIIKSSLSKAESMGYGKISEVYVGVPGEFCSVAFKTVNLTFPSVKKITEFDTESIFRTGNSFEKETAFYPINQSVIYYEIDEQKRVIDPVGMRSKSLVGNISYVLARTSFVNLIQDIFSKLRITIKGFISSILAESMYIIEPEDRDRYALIADVGYISTSVALVQGNGLLSLFSFSLGGAYISSDLYQCLRIPYSEAEKLKEKVALAWVPAKEDNYMLNIDGNTFTYSAKATNEIAYDRLEIIADYIQKCIDYTGYEIPSFVPLKLCGGGISMMKGVRNILSKKLKRQVLPTTYAGEHKIKPFNASSWGLLSFVLENINDLEKIIIKI